ncbi:MAG: hypothetical protein J6X44_03580 [Thermoguttaceae bacterium]|nr:hypothetical protein [Thermoguttaceae bacterium]
MKLTWKSWFYLVVALGLGFVAAYLVRCAFFTDKDVQVVEEDSSTGVQERLLVANGFLAAGTEIDATNVRLELTPEKDVPRDGVFSFSDFVGRKTTRDYKDGEPISLYDVEALEEVQGTETAFVPPGYSVVPIEICSATKVNGSRNYLRTTKLEKIVKPGDLVDFVVVKENLDNPSSTQRRRLSSTTIVSVASVFSIDDVSRLSDVGVVRTSILSALLNSDELELVRKASEEGKIKIVLNGQQDDATSLETASDLNLSDALSQGNDGFIIQDQDDEDDAIAPQSDEGSKAPKEPDSLMATPNLNSGFVIADPDFDDEPAIIKVSDSVSDVSDNWPMPNEPFVAKSVDGVFPPFSDEVEPRVEDSLLEEDVQDDELTLVPSEEFSQEVAVGATPSPRVGSVSKENAIIRGDVRDEPSRGTFVLKSPFVNKGEPWRRSHRRGSEERK